MAKLLNHYKANSTGRDYVVGDIHGQFTVLESLLGHIGFDPRRDRLFSVGDLVDRGPESHRVTTFLNKPWFHAILGNHEVMLLESAYTVTALPEAREHAPLWRMNGGGWFFEQSTREQQAIYEAINQLPLAAEVALPDGRRTGVVHANVDRNATNGRHWSRISETADTTFQAGEFDQVSDLVWSRELAYAVVRAVEFGTPVDATIHGVDAVFLGHTPQETPVRVDNTRWLDTGAGYGRRLSVAELSPEGRVWSMAITSRSVTEGWKAAARK